MSRNFLHDIPDNDLQKLFVFDLDYTLWPLEADEHINPPVRLTAEGKVVDRFDNEIKLHTDVVEIFQSLHTRSITIAVASRSTTADLCEKLLQLFDIYKYITYKEIYPRSKVNHFKKLKQNSGRDYKDMIFFDDHIDNILEISELGVTCRQVRHGLTWDDVKVVLCKELKSE